MRRAFKLRNGGTRAAVVLFINTHTAQARI
jgi:hypothetical protein